MRWVLLSNGYAPGAGRYLQHALSVLAGLLGGISQVAFVPYAQRDWDGHAAVVAAALEPLGVQVVGVHRLSSSRSFVESAEAMFVGGGERLSIARRHAPV